MLVKLVVLHHLPDMNDLPACERWFWKHHCPEVLRHAPWTRRYVNYRAVPAPSGAEGYGYFNYRLHENWRSDAEYPGFEGTLSMTPQPGTIHAVCTLVPGAPTEDFKGTELRPDEKTILRWIVLFKYPEGVSKEEGERWYLDVHVPEVMRQPGLTRFMSHRALPRHPLLPAEGGVFRPGATLKHRPFAEPTPLFFATWDRLSEMWYENGRGWRQSIVEAPPVYTAPPWARYGRYPFLEPGVDFVSTFILERPTEDLLRNLRPEYV